MENFVTPKIRRLTLHDGAFVDITERLTHGETEDLNARIRPMGGFDMRWVRTARIVAYLLGWSLTKGGAPVPYSPDLPEQERIDIVRALDPDRAVEIFLAIDAHEDAMAAERAAQKKMLHGSPDAKPISPSPSAAAGASDGSVN